MHPVSALSWGETIINNIKNEKFILDLNIMRFLEENRTGRTLLIMINDVRTVIKTTSVVFYKFLEHVSRSFLNAIGI